jgi:hypothetical protein
MRFNFELGMETKKALECFEHKGYELGEDGEIFTNHLSMMKPRKILPIKRMVEDHHHQLSLMLDKPLAEVDTLALRQVCNYCYSL